MVDITATIEHDSVDALCLSAFCNQLADLAGSFLVAGGAFKILLTGSGGNERNAVDVVDNLCVDVGVAAVDVQAGPFGRAEILPRTRV